MGAVGALRMLVAAELRRRWRSAVVLIVLIGATGALVCSTAAGARRSHTAFTRFDAGSRAATATVALRFPTAAQLAAFGRLPEVAHFAVARGVFVQFTSAPSLSPVAAVDDAYGTAVDRGRVVQGRAANSAAPDEITVGESVAKQHHWHVGTELDVQSATPSQAERFLAGQADPNAERPAGPQVRIRIVGIDRRPLDLGRLGALGGAIVLTPGFTRAYSNKIGAWGELIRVRLRDGGADIPRLAADVPRIFGPVDENAVSRADVDSGGVQNAVNVVVVALWIFAAVLALAGIVAVAIMLAREVHLSDVDPATARALGLTRGQQIAASGLRAALLGSAGAVVAVVGALLASPLFPVGIARRAEPDPGLHADWPVLTFGAVAIVAVAVTTALAASWLSSRRATGAPVQRRTANIPEAAARAGLAPSFTNGLRMALQPGHGRTAVPVRSALLGMIFGVLGVTAVVGYASSLGELVTTPHRYGWTWDYAARDNGAVPYTCLRTDDGLLRERAIGDVTSVCEGDANVRVDGRTMAGWAFIPLRGTIGPEIVEGRAPNGPREVALGAQTLSALHKRIGETVKVTAVKGTLDYTIVGRVVLPTLADTQPVADGATFTGDGWAPLFPKVANQNFTRYLVVRVAPGASRAVALRRLDAVPQLGPPVAASLPTEVARLHQVGWFPAALAVVLGGLALIAVGYTLVTGVGRRRRDLAVLKTLGSTRRQVRATVAWQATTQAVVGLLVGVPVGVFVGSAIWRAVADGIGVATTARVPVVALLLTIAGALLSVNIIAALPARSAANTRPAVALHTE